MSDKVKKFFFSSESVTEGHPDKLCDSISDSVLDACLSQDPKSKVACESLAKSNFVVVAGEITTKAKVNFEDIIRNRLKEIGYDDVSKGIDYKTCDIFIKITQQSPDINAAVLDKKTEENIGAGDQGLMFGYATNETPEMMPFSHQIASQLTLKLTEVRKNGTLKWLRPDGKAEVTVEYEEINGVVKPISVETVLISCQHSPEVSNEEITKGIIENVIKPVVPEKMMNEKTKILVNPSGRFVVGGPEGDCGLTGRKIIVDTYGGWGAHGGGAFFGKDSSKVDRSGAYLARWIAKSLIFNDLCERCLVQISYSIGVAQPLSVYVNSYGTAKNGRSDQDLAEIVKKNFDMRPGVIIKNLKLDQPIFKKTSTGGHFGRNLPEFTWETPKKMEI